MQSNALLARFTLVKSDSKALNFRGQELFPDKAIINWTLCDTCSRVKNKIPNFQEQKCSIKSQMKTPTARTRNKALPINRLLT